MKYPRDVEIFMDRFAQQNPGCSWRAILAAFDIAMQKSMREGGSLFEQFGSPHAGEHEHDDREQR